MRLRDIGEFELIERMAVAFGQSRSFVRATASATGLVMGIGDDAAVWAAPASGFTIATTDAMVEGVHFTERTTDWYDLGWKAMASNLSDIAGMGGSPRYALAVLAASGDQEVDQIVQLCRGMADIAGSYGASVVGGDTVTSPITMITITLIGETAVARQGQAGPVILSRFDARPGDLVAVTGNLGSSAAGLDLLSKGEALPEDLEALANAHRRPLPRVREGQMLVEAGVRCGMDLSDGLAGDLLRICRASGVAAEIDVERIPREPLLAQVFGPSAVDFAVAGGEDYELLCTAPSEVIERAQRMLGAAGTPLTVIGRILEAYDVADGQSPVRILDSRGLPYSPRRAAWEHFSSGVGAGGD